MRMKLPNGAEKEKALCTAATGQSTKENLKQLNSTMTAAKEQEFFAFYENATSLECANTELERVKTILCLIREALDSKECSDYVKQYEAVAIAAHCMLGMVCADVKKVSDHLHDCAFKQRKDMIKC